MKNMKMIMAVPALLLTMTACGAENAGNKTVINAESGRTITVIEEAGKKTGAPGIAVDEIVKYEDMEISDWLDENTIIVSKENESLDKMSLEELSDSHPRSLYKYHLDTKKFELIKELKNLHMGGATLSPDKKNMIYQEYNLGDPLFWVMNLDSKKAFPLSGDSIGGALSAKWVDDATIFGAAFNGKAFTATPAGNITTQSWTEEPLFISEQINDKIYYNTNSNSELMALDLKTKKTASMKLDQVVGVYPSPDKKQLLILRSNDANSTLYLTGLNGEDPKKLVEGPELDGVSWSPDQRMIAYTLKSEAKASAGHSLHIYDLLSHKSSKLAVGIEFSTTNWSPTGKELVYTEYDGEKYKSSIVYLNLSLQK